jgi:hypothetical protein
LALKWLGSGKSPVRIKHGFQHAEVSGFVSGMGSSVAKESGSYQGTASAVPKRYKEERA